MIVKANCKINIGLNITNRREDGYHDIESLFVPIGLYDQIEILPSKGQAHELTIQGLAIDGEIKNNLILKTAGLLDIPPVRFTLRKNVPTGAGLGGGSSDAAATLMALNQMFRLDLSNEQMEKMLLKIGADCPFFVKKAPQYVQGIGDILTPTNTDILKGLYIAVIKPDVFVSTKEAYAGVTPQKNHSNILDAIKAPIEEWKYLLKNDFENNILHTHPEIAKAKQTLYKAGASYAQMSGSGASVFGLFKAPIPNIQTPEDWFFWEGQI